MGRRVIELSFYDKKYTIEYNRASVRKIIKLKDSGDEVEQLITLIKAGLEMHHSNDMPSDDDIFGWVLALGDDMKAFAEELQSIIEDVVNTFKEDRKNLKWGKVEL